MTGNTGGTGPAPSGIGGPPPKRKVQMDSGQERETEHPGDLEWCRCSPQLDPNEPTATPQDPMVSAPLCPDRKSDPPDSDSAGTQALRTPPSCLRGRRKRPRLRVQFQAPPLPSVDPSWLSC